MRETVEGRELDLFSTLESTSQSIPDTEALPMGIFLLLATPPERAVWLTYAFYLLTLLVPIIPVVIIYRLFPESKTDRAADGAVGKAGAEPAVKPERPEETSRITGKIGPWQITAIGAWGAYITALVLGYLAIKTAVPLIKKVSGGSIWTIDLDFALQDADGKEVDNESVQNLTVEPPRIEPWGKHATIRQWSETSDPPNEIHVKMDGYEVATVPLRGVSAENNEIKLHTPVTLKKIQAPVTSGTPLPAVPTGSGPAPLPIAAVPSAPNR
jgi:hypothetical protein